MEYKVIIETSIVDTPKEHELRAALILANKYFLSDVTFLRTGMAKSPDIEVHGKRWEIKSPTGSSARTIENNMRVARKQSAYLVVDLTRIKLHQAKALSNIRRYIRYDSRQFKKVLAITKSKRVIEIL